MAIPCAAKNVDVTRPLREQKKPDYVCEPGDSRVKKYGWKKSQFRGYLSIIDKTVWISAIWSNQPGRGNLSRLIKNLHKAGFEIKVPQPFPRMAAICERLNFKNIPEFFEEADTMIDCYVLPIKGA